MMSSHVKEERTHVPKDIPTGKLNYRKNYGNEKDQLSIVIIRID